MTMEKVCLWDKDERLIGSVEMNVRENNGLALYFAVSHMEQYTTGEIAEVIYESDVLREYTPVDHDYKPIFGGYNFTVSFDIPDGDFYGMVDDSLHSEFSDHENDWYAESVVCGQTDLREYFPDMPDELRELIDIWDEWHLKIAPEEVIQRATELFDSLPEITPEEVWHDLGIRVCLRDVLNELEDDQLKELSGHIGWSGQEAYICVDGYIGYRERGWWGSSEDEILGTLNLAPEYWRDSLIEWGIYDEETDGISEDADWEIVRDFMTDDVFLEFVGRGDNMI